MSKIIRWLAVALMLFSAPPPAHAVLADFGVCRTTGEVLVERFNIDTIGGTLPLQTFSGLCGTGRFTTSGGASFDLAGATIAASTSVQQSGASSVQRRVDGSLRDVLRLDQGAFSLHFALDGTALNGFNNDTFADIRVQRHVVTSPGVVLDTVVFDTILRPGQVTDTAELRRLSFILPDLSVLFSETFFTIQMNLRATSGGLLGQDGEADVRLTATLNPIGPDLAYRTDAGIFSVPETVPEPASAGVLLAALLGLAVRRRRPAHDRSGAREQLPL